MHHIVLAEIGKHLFKLLIFQTIRNGTFHQFLHPVSYKAAHLIYASLRKAIRLEGIIAARSQIAQGRKQGTIQVEDIGIEIKLSMRRHLLHTEFTTMKDADILGIKSDFILTANRIAVGFLRHQLLAGALQYIELGKYHIKSLLSVDYMGSSLIGSKHIA